MHEDASEVLEKTQWVKIQMICEVILSSKLSLVAKPKFVTKDADASRSDVIIWIRVPTNPVAN